jgi:hypothetical protein
LFLHFLFVFFNTVVGTPRTDTLAPLVGCLLACLLAPLRYAQVGIIDVR